MNVDDVAEAAAILEQFVDLVDDDELETTPVQRAYLAGVAAGLAAIAEGADAVGPRS